jgi:signal-transduction protein with cAMP-binding, CBS, and nucleotidyltransferase domain
MNTGIKVLDAMTTKPVSVKLDSTATEAAKNMRKFKVGSALVKDGDEIVGIVTELDFVEKLIAKGLNPNDTLVADICEKDLITISPDKDIYDAMIVLKEEDIRRLPVKENGKIIGMLTMKDILKIEPQLFEVTLETIQLREESTKPVPDYSNKEEGMCESCGNFSYRLVYSGGIKICPDCRAH